MANLMLSKIQIHKMDKNQNRFNPEFPYYITAEALEEDNFFAEPVTVSLLESRHKALVQRIRQYYPTGEKYNGLNADLKEEDFDPVKAEETMDKRLRELPNSMIVHQFLGGAYVNKYNQDILDASGNEIPNKKEGMWVRTNDGHIKVYTHRDFAVPYTYIWVDVYRDGKMQRIPKCDETGMPIMVPMKGWDPEEQAKDYRERFLFPITDVEDKYKKDLPDEYRSTSFGTKPSATKPEPEEAAAAPEL